jgi:acetyl esterase/lipase
METIVHPATDPDLAAVASLVAGIRGAADSGRETLGRLGEPETAFATRPFRSGSVEGERVAAPGTHGDGVLLYLHGRRFQFDEPAAVYAARLSAATRLPVLHLRYRLAAGYPYPAALDDVVEAYQAMLAQGTPPSQIVVAGHSAGATLALSALLELRDAGSPMPAAAVALSPVTDFTLSGKSIAGNDGKDVITLAEARQVAAAYLASADPGGAIASGRRPLGPAAAVDRLR